MKRKKQFISLILASFMILSVVCTCASSDLDTFAASGGSLLDYFPLSSDDFITSDSSFIDDSISSAFNSSVPSNVINYSYNFGGSYTYDVSDYYLIYYDANNMKVSYGFIPNNSFCNVVDNKLIVFIPTDNNPADFTFCYAHVMYDNFSTYLYQRAGTQTIDDVSYNYYYFNKSSSFYTVSTNLPIYSLPDNFSSLDDAENFNGTPIYDSSNPTGEDSSNNLFMVDGDFIFKHSDYYAPYSDVINTGSIYPNGTVKFVFDPNIYQTLNPDDFTLSLSFTFDYDVNYKFSATNDNPPFYKNGLSNKWKNCNLRFIYSNGGSETIDIPLSTFINQGNSYSLTFEDIMSHMEGSGYSLSNVLSISKEVTSLQYNKFNINCTAFLSSNGDSSGNYTEWYNPINKKGYTTDKSSEVNSNPYYNSDDAANNEYDDAYDDLFVPGTAGTGGDNANNVGGGSSSSSSSTGGSSSATTGSITINNTNNNNNSNSLSDGSSGFGKFLTTVLDLLSDGQEASSDTIMDMTDANGFMDVASTELSAVPTSLWTILLTSFSVCIGITIVAVVLGLLLKIFT